MYPTMKKVESSFWQEKKEKKTRNGDKCIEITLMAPHKCKDHDGNLVTWEVVAHASSIYFITWVLNFSFELEIKSLDNSLIPQLFCQVQANGNKLAPLSLIEKINGYLHDMEMHLNSDFICFLPVHRHWIMNMSWNILSYLSRKGFWNSIVKIY